MKEILNIEDFLIGKLEYSFDAEVYFSRIREGEGEFSPPCQGIEIDEIEIISDIVSFDTETEEENLVTDPKEIKMIKDWIDWKEEIGKKL